MPENRQFRQRLEAWQRELKNQILTPVQRVDFSGCETMERLRPGDAARLPLRAMPAGTRWGRRREYAWFFARTRLPEDCAGQRLVLLSGVGGEQTVWVNGEPRGSVDKQHGYVTLCRTAEAGAALELTIESYAGHGARLENYGPCPPERQPIPPVPEAQCTVQASWIARFDEEAYQLWMDADTLIRLAMRLPEESLRRMEIAEALRDYTHIVDFEAPAPERAASCKKARERLAEALARRNGGTAPVLHLIGQSHIDLAWLWPMEETWHKAVRTYANQLALMEEYPEYRFLACEPALLEMLRESGPELYGRMLERVRAGQIQPEGAFYVECDTNIPSGESLVRQLLWGKRWYRRELGVESRVAWQPDTFGFTPCLPQLLQAFDIPYFATQKLLRADPECERFPYQDFLWEGIDGTRVQACSFFKNNARTDPDNLLDRWEKHRSQAEGIRSLLYPFGYGDGGGADRDMLEYLRRERDLEGLPRTEWCSLPEHFERTAEDARANLWRGELYLAWHRGTYTVQRRTKTALRALEQTLHDAEWLLADCGPETRARLAEPLRDAWRTLLIHQFHDIAAGVGIRDTHAEAVAALTAAAERIERELPALAAGAWDIRPEKDCATVVNTLSFPRREWVALPGGASGWAELPAGGARTLTAADLTPPEGKVRAAKTEAGWEIDNGVLRFTLTADGAICGLTDLRSGLPLQDPGMRMNDLRLYRNVEPVYDAWELSRDYPRDRLDAVRTTAVALSGQDTDCLTVRIRRQIGESPSEQTVTVRAGTARIAFALDVDWRERHKLLQTHFESNLVCDRAIHEMQFCHIERPAHRDTPAARDRYEVCNHHYSALFEATRGLAVFNRAIWGVHCEDGDLALTLLRAPCVPDDTCDRGPQHFEYALGVYGTPFALSGVTEEGYAYNVPPRVFPGRGRTGAGIRAEGALVETVKPAEEGSGLVIRLWEPRGARTWATLRLPHPMEICACSFDEEQVTPLTVSDQWRFEMRAFEVRTLLVRDGKG